MWYYSNMRKNCKICDQEFQAVRGTKIYCSRKCNSKSQYIRNGETILARNAMYRNENREVLNKNNLEYHHKTKDIQNTKRRSRYFKNKEQETANKRKKYQDNPEKYKEINKKWIENNKESRREYMRFFCAQRRALKINATIGDFNKEIRKIYKNCPKGYEVDHIMPLINKSMCGLHVPWNLQYLTVKENRMKSNKLIGDL